ncbi:MAG: hypothetical protein GX773_04285, partial [Chloroflexi bacterium]|nr:hypothetical protein [Chloroflexota bacterium]
MVPVKTETNEDPELEDKAANDERQKAIESAEFTDDPIQLYLKDITHTRLLDARDEFHLSVMIQAHEQLSLYQNDEGDLDGES